MKKSKTGRQTNESKGLPTKVHYPERVNPDYIPKIKQFIKTLDDAK